MNIFHEVSKITTGMLGLIFPKFCVACSNGLNATEEVLCLECEFKLPRTDFHLDKENPVAKHFWGRIQIENAFSFLLFQKGESVQKLLHALKYDDRQDVGVYLGKQFGFAIEEWVRETDISCIVPVPLHPKKEFKRGYNQCNSIADGLSEVLDLPAEKQAVQRIIETITQTGKDRFDRWENVEGIFEVAQPDKIKDKHILLIDDVVTTGSTLEACATEILKLEGTKVTLATIASA